MDGWSGYPCYDYKSTCGAKDRNGTQACLHQINQTGPTGPKAPSSLVWQRVAWSILPLSGSSLSGCQTEIALLAALTRCKAPRSLEWEFEKSVEKGLLLECLWKGWRLVMHNACFFSQNVYSPTLNGTTRAVHVLSHCSYGLLANTFTQIVFRVFLT